MERWRRVDVERYGALERRRRVDVEVGGMERWRRVAGV